jgi:riboflavin synthase
MFTGIIQSTGTVKSVISNGSNRSFWISSPLLPQFRVDQSVSHDGVCLTVEEIREDSYRVTAIEETLQLTTLSDWTEGRIVNLEQSLRLSDRLDGHLVQGHADATATCEKRKEKNGSWEYRFSFPARFAELLIEKGSVCVNGVSLTAFKVKKQAFTVAVIPYTFEHTNLSAINKGDKVNIEFDVLGKYLLRKLSLKA